MIFNCFSCFKVSQDKNTNRNQHYDGGKLRLVLIGLNNAGKTTLLNTLRGIDCDTTPTYGFISQTIQNAGGVDIEVYDLGGGKSIRKIWERYYSEVYGAIFVIDASDYSRVDEAKQALSEALSDYRMKGKPLLIFANKQDIEGAMQASDIVMKLGLMSFDSANDKDNDHNDNDTATDNKDTSASTSKSITTAPDQFSVIACSAKAKAGASLSNVDSSIRNGVSWLQSAIESDLANLTARVTRQAAEQRAEEDRKREERRLRVEQAREERRRQEEEDEGKEKETRKKTKEERSSSSGSSGGNIDTQPCTSTSEKDTSNDSVDIVDVSIKDGYSENGNNNKSMNEEQQAENYDSLNKLDDTVNNDDVMDSVKKLQVPPPISPCIIRDNDNEEVNNDTNGGMISSGSENAYAKVSVPGSYPSPQPSPSK